MALPTFFTKLFASYGNAPRIKESVTLPAQASQSGKFLKTDGTSTSWDSIDLSSKQDVISDLSTIRSGAALGATAQQPATTLSGYGITDANISNGVITLGSNTITPLTSHQDITGKANLSGASFTGGVKEATVAMSGASIDLSSGNCFTKTITEDVTLTVTNAGSCSCFTLILTNGGSATVTWFSGVLWAGGTPPTLTSSGVDAITFITPDGTTWYGVPSSIDAKTGS